MQGPRKDMQHEALACPADGGAVCLPPVYSHVLQDISSNQHACHVGWSQQSVHLNSYVLLVEGRTLFATAQCHVILQTDAGWILSFTCTGIKGPTWKLLIQGCCSICSTVGRAEGTLFRAAVTNCFEGSDILLGKAGAEVQMAACMLASDAPAALKGALQNNKSRHPISQVALPMNM